MEPTITPDEINRLYQVESAYKQLVTDFIHYVKASEQAYTALEEQMQHEIELAALKTKVLSKITATS